MVALGKFKHGSNSFKQRKRSFKEDRKLEPPPEEEEVANFISVPRLNRRRSSTVL